MKKNKNISKLVATAAIAVASIAPSFAQSNLGAACGCPAVAGRPTRLLSTMNGYTAIAGTYGGELTLGATLYCDTTYIIDKKIYIPSGKVINIAPGTVLKGKANAVAAEATALIIERGAKINAEGQADCQVVFTAEADVLDGKYPISEKGKWGGLVVLGKATNNLTLAANGPFVPGGAGKLAVADGLGTVEGFASTNPQDQYGVQLSTPANLASSNSPASSTYTFDLALKSVQDAGTGVSTKTKITFSSSTLAAYVFAGMTITGTGIPAGTTVTEVKSAVITFSLPLNLDAAGTYSFTGTYPLAPSTAGTFYTLPAVSGTYPTSAPAFENSTYGPFGATNSIINYAAPYFAAGVGTFDDNDNSGVMKYVSIRHSGAILAVGAEINGLTLASVGRGTTIEHIEIVSCADDNIELFGGTVNLKYVSTLFGNDDMIDYDLGWSGKAQFIFGMKTDINASADSDNGFEADSYDNSSVGLKSKPVFYNVTMVGNAKATGNSDNSALAAINMKDGSEGEIYNSVFANFRNGLNLVSANTGGAQPNTLASWNSGALKVKCNTFVGVTNPGTIAATSSAFGTAFDGTQLAKFTTTDLNTIVTGNTLPGFNYDFTVSSYPNNTISVKNDVVPNPALSTAGCPTAPIDGFFRAAAYRGAFSSDPKNNWLSDWSYSQVLGTTKGLVSCPTDINADGVTNVNDFLQLSGQFGKSCN
jgi:hypothetical protein